MKYLIVLIFLVLFQTNGFGGDILIEDYEIHLKFLKECSKSFCDKNYLDNLIIVNKKTKEEKKLSQLSLLEKDVFLLDFLEFTASQMLVIYDCWNKELQKFDDPKNSMADKKITKKDVEEYIKQLQIIRKNFAINQEKFVENFVLNHKKDVGKKELEDILNNVHEFNDKNNLIKRE